MPDTRTLLTLFIIIIITIVIVIVVVKTIDPMSNLHWFRDLILIIATRQAFKTASASTILSDHESLSYE